jgi:hypothetical protein
VFVAGPQITIIDEEITTGKIMMSVLNDVHRHHNTADAETASYKEIGQNLDRMLHVGVELESKDLLVILKNAEDGTTISTMTNKTDDTMADANIILETGYLISVTDPKAMRETERSRRWQSRKRVGLALKNTHNQITKNR